MLCEHHRARLDRMLDLKDLQRCIYETEFLLLRYQRDCFESEAEKNQYMKDIKAIKRMINEERDLPQQPPPDIIEKKN